MALRDKLKLRLKVPLAFQLPGSFTFKLPAFAFKPPKAMLALSPALAWHLALAVLVLLCAWLMAILWWSGKKETAEAMASGRRLVLTLSDGSIKGKVITTKVPEVLPAPVPQSEEDQKEEGQPAVAGETQAGPDLSALVSHAPAAVSVALPGLNAALTEETKDGTLPIIGADGTKPWVYYGKPFAHQGGQPMIVVIVTGLGQNKLVSQAALRLPEDFTLSFAPYAQELGTWGMGARAAGHEVLLDLPMEATNYPASDPGPHGLLINRAPAENEENLRWLMARLPIYVGFFAPQNEAFTADDNALKLLLQSLANRGLLLTVGHEPAKANTKEILESSSAVTLLGDVLIDEDLSATAIQAQLTNLEQIAKKRGYAIGVAQPFPLTIEQLHIWSKMLAERGFQLTPLSAAAKLKSP